MTGWQISQTEKIEKVETNEILENMDSVKIKLTRALLTEEDYSTYAVEDKSKKLPIIPCRSAVGTVIELASDNSYVEKGTRVYFAPVIPCGKCYHCTNGKEKECYDFLVAGKNRNGFLKDFTVSDVKNLYPLPSSVSDEDALYIEHIALCLTAIDKLDIQKGEHVAIIGGSMLGIILAQLVIYYQGVPVLIDDNEENITLAKRAGIYYTLDAKNKPEKEIIEITGGRLSGKVVFISHSDLPLDLAFKVSAPSAKVAILGFSVESNKAQISTAMDKQVTCMFALNGYGNIEVAINLLANKAIDISVFNLKKITPNEIEKVFASNGEKVKNGLPCENLIVNLLD